MQRLLILVLTFPKFVGEFTKQSLFFKTQKFLEPFHACQTSLSYSAITVFESNFCCWRFSFLLLLKDFSVRISVPSNSIRFLFFPAFDNCYCCPFFGAHFLSPPIFEKDGLQTQPFQRSGWIDSKAASEGILILFGISARKTPLSKSSFFGGPTFSTFMDKNLNELMFWLQMKRRCPTVLISIQNLVKILSNVGRLGSKFITWPVFSRLRPRLFKWLLRMVLVLLERWFSGSSSKQFSEITQYFFRKD